MDISIFLELAYADPDRRDLSAVFEQGLQQVELADKLGYRNVWITEHHFLPGFSASSSPEIFLAAAAVRTKNIRLGHGIVLLPYRINHPLRIAERVATLDSISGGRVDWGGGRAISEIELGAFGVDPDDTVHQWEEALAAIPQMWMNDEFEWDTPTLQVPKRNVVPKPLQEPHPPMFVAATQPRSLEFAGKNGLGVLGFGVQQSDAGSFVEIYEKCIADANPIGGFVTKRFNVFIIALCLEEQQEALDVQVPNFRRYWEYVEQLYKPWTKLDKPPESYRYALESILTAQEAMQKTSMEELSAAGGAAVGDIDHCVETLQVLADAGVDEVMLHMGSFATPHDKVMRSIELFATEVLPRVKQSTKV
jgi:alkanesulfonate monooxygenase SsuD/methylene tetrahydromethanopterin reductase-like flavin-dependent oxidoreductase (luciferase family)